jgi:hypothetical protein
VFVTLARPRLVGALLSAVAFLLAAAAQAEMTKEQCIDANAKGQDLLHDGKLTAARVELQSCASSTCPAIIQSDCAKRLDDLERRQPAIVFDAKDASGNDLSAVRVTMDGAPLLEKLDGTALHLDPGEHVFVFTTAGAPPVTKKLVLVERGQARRERVVFSPDREMRELSGPASAPHSPAGPAGGMTTLRALGLVSGGAGIVAIGVASAFALMAASALSSQRSACASPTNCPNHDQAVSDHSTFTTDSSIGTAGFVSGGVLLAAGVAMFLAGGAQSSPGTSTGVLVIPELATGSAGLAVHAAF